jgi:MYXO-CTERM domain-containing protein
MISTPVLRRRGLGARLVPFIIALGALPLMAPTCGSSGEGVKVFSRRSLIIPMDVCYQYSTDSSGQTYAPAGGATECPAVDPGDVIKAYGLVYQLVRNGIAVYWVIDNAKTSVTGVDLTVQYDGGVPVYLFDWATGVEGAAPTIGNGGHLINYRGGPFVVDGSDFARAAAVLQNFRSTFGSVNVHVANVAFRGYSKRTMAGGWSAGGATPPKLALLDIGSSGSGAKNSEVVIQGYLNRAGLNTAGAMGYADPAQGVHGEIFDRLFLPDFLANPAGSGWTTSRLATNAYQILWVPHWTAPSSCSDCPPSTSCTCSVKYTSAQILETLQTIGSFVNDTRGATRLPGDLFAECAGLGSFEGVFSSRGGYNGNFTIANPVGGEPSTHFETTSDATHLTGVSINASVTSPLYRGNFSSPLMQIGDFQFQPRDGAIQNFRPQLYKSEVVRLISDSTTPDYDIFTWVPGTTTHGTIVYLGGHSYSGTDPDSSFQIAGSRLVLNTLFNLGSSCTATGVACSTGLAGVCAVGHYVCQAGAPDPVCVPDVQPGTRTEICNGLDDDCDGQVDEDLQTGCYQAPAGYVDPRGRTGAAFQATSSVGVCRRGISVCQRNADGTYSMSTCTGQVLPTAEACNGLDDDCNGIVDDPDALPTISCYDGPPGTQDVGICRGGTEVCQNGQWGSVVNGTFTQGVCANEVLPRPEICDDAGEGLVAKDDDCNGVVNNGCTCTAGATSWCFTGPGTAGVGTCVHGTQTCQTGGYWGSCDGQVVAVTEPCVAEADWVQYACTAYPVDDPTTCRRFDVNCDQRVTKCKVCKAGDTRTCLPTDPSLPALPAGASWGVGQCSTGSQTCTAAGEWGACTGFVLPSTDKGALVEYCDGTDNNCNGTRDENALCPPGQACINGVCVQKYCGTEQAAPEGYACSASVDPGGSHTVVQSSCGAMASGCGTGQLCKYGNCIDPCPVTTAGTSATCATGTICTGGACIAGGCYEAGCPAATDLCVSGACQPDPCAGKLCPSGTFCRMGDCVQACTFVTCYVGQKCGIDGFCEADACAGKLCGAGQRCADGVCAADPCVGKGCAAGQICQARGTAAVCVDDPCKGVVCPAGICAGGQCFPSGNPTGAGTAQYTTETTNKGSSGGCGCGSGSGAAFPALLALLAAPLARRRRRAAPGGRGGAALLLVLVAVAAGATGCKSSKKTSTHFDPTSCKATCPGEERCIDISTDPSHCGATVALACGHACGTGEQCVDGVCGPSTQVAPFISAMSPTVGMKDDPAFVVSIAGQRIQQGASVRITTGAATRSVTCDAATCAAGPCCQWNASGHITVLLDLTDAVTSAAWTLRIVNPDRVISNPKTLGIAVPVPTLTDVTPNPVPAGSATTLHVTGTGFTSGSRCVLTAVTGIGDLALSTTFSGDATRLTCVLDATSIPPGVYPLTVVGEPDSSGVSQTSNSRSVTVSPTDPVILSVDPGFVDPHGVATKANFLITGIRFDVGSAAVLFSVPPAEDLLAAQYVTTASPSAIFVHDLPVGPGTPRLEGTYTVAVRNLAANRTSNGVSFTVGATAARAVNTFTPSLAYQGEVVTLAFTGTDFPADARIELEPPGSSTYTAIATTVNGTGTGATGPMNFAGQPDGQWYVRLRFGATAAAATSAPWPLRILSNQAILRDYSTEPAPSQGGTVGGQKTTLTFAVSNIRSASVKILLVDPAGTSTVATLTPTSIAPNPADPLTATTLTVTGSPALSLAGYATGTYTFRVANPNAQASNALPFAVNPGAPTVSSVCVAGTSCRTWAVQGQPLTIRITGTNFAQPDASGNGSVVMVAAPFMPGWPAADPCSGTATGTQFRQITGTATVVSPTVIDVVVDTLSAYVDPNPNAGTTYAVSVWNPGAAGLQKSSCGVDPSSALFPAFRLCPSATGTCAQ